MCFKLKIETVAQGLANLSYERLVPKTLSFGTLRVVKNDQLFLDKVKAWKDFDHPETGIREVLIKEMEDFETAH